MHGYYKTGGLGPIWSKWQVPLQNSIEKAKNLKKLFNIRLMFYFKSTLSYEVVY